MKYIFSLLIIFFSFSNAQSQIKEIEGIGPFKIGKMTTVDLQNLANQSGLKKTTIATLQDALGEKEAGLYEVLPNRTSPSDSPAFSSFCPGTKVYLLPEYKVSEIEIKNIYLIFYANKLISFISDSSVFLQEALNTKYGQAPVKMKEKTTECNGLTLSLKTFSTVWQTIPIRVSEASAQYYDLDCKSHIRMNLYAFDIHKNAEESACNSQYREVLDAKKDTKQRQKLKDF